MLRPDQYVFVLKRKPLHKKITKRLTRPISRKRNNIVHSRETSPRARNIHKLSSIPALAQEWDSRFVELELAVRVDVDVVLDVGARGFGELGCHAGDAGVGDDDVDAVDSVAIF